MFLRGVRGSATGAHGFAELDEVLEVHFVAHLAQPLGQGRLAHACRTLEENKAKPLANWRERSDAPEGVLNSGQRGHFKDSFLNGKMRRWTFAAAFVLALCALVFQPDKPLSELENLYLTPSSSYLRVDVAPNVPPLHVHVTDDGPPDAPPLLLLHGTSSSLHTFDAWLPFLLKEGYRVIRLDLPPFGLTGPHPLANYAEPSYDALLRHLLAARNVSCPVLVGNSLGGRIAWRAAKTLPCARLVLVGASGYRKPSQRSEASRDNRLVFRLAQSSLLAPLLAHVRVEWLVEHTLKNEVYFNPALVTPPLVKRYADLNLRAGNRRGFLDRLKFRNYSFLREDESLEGVGVPALILWGRHDRWEPPPHAELFREDLKNSEVWTFEAGHVPHEEVPEESVAYLLNFLRYLSFISITPPHPPAPPLAIIF
jgi:pimeloyl-ACP methyl ester carboxylesterase